MKNIASIHAIKSVRAVLAALLLCGFGLPVSAHADVAANRPTSVGYLEVFSSTREVQWSEGTYYYPHTGYCIYAANGTVMKWVENQNSVTDAAPQQVELAPGTYNIWAQSDKAGFVTRPVTIKPSQTTEVHL